MLRIIIKNLKNLLLGWGIIVPLSCLIYRKKDLVVFIGKNRGKFFDNVKYLFLHLHRSETKTAKYYYLTERKCVNKMLKQNDLPVLFYPSIYSMYILLRANIVILDDTTWINHYKYYFLFKSKKIQMWHGIGLKKKGLLLDSEREFNNSLKGKLHNAIRGKQIIYDLFTSSSEFFIRESFSKAFKSKHFLASGNARNDLLFREKYDKYDLLGADEITISRLEELRNAGYKIVLYAPTFRDTGGDAISEGVLRLKDLALFAEEHKIIFVFKFHSYTTNVDEKRKYDTIIYYDNSKDIQPLLSLTDILITDYSSVYMDYLLINKSIIFFPFDHDKYIQKDRQLIFDYEWITPGAKCYSQDDLQEKVLDCIEQKDSFSTKREEIKNIAFKYTDGQASKRIWDFIEKNYIKN